MRIAKRICVFSLALTIAFLSVGYEPPKANAVVAESAIVAEASAVAAAYMSATGLTLGASSAAAASAGTASLISGYAAATGGTVEVITTSIVAGATIGTGGVIILSVAAVAALAAITAWAIDEYGLIGEDGEPVTDAVGIVPGIGEMCLYNGKELPDIEPIWEQVGKTAYPYVLFSTGTSPDGNIGTMYFVQKELVHKAGGLYSVDGGSLSYYHAYYTGGTSWDGPNGPYMDNAGACFALDNYHSWAWSNFDILTADGTVFLAASEPASSEDWDNPVLYAELSPDYETPPELAPDTQVVLNPDLAPEFYPDAAPTPEALSEAIFEKLANGDFTPQYTEQPVADPDPDPDTGGGDNPDDGTDEEPDTGVDLSGVLGWLEAIWNAIKSLVEAIGDKLMQLFVPSEEYMEALPEALTDAFAERTGFLTYPMSLLFGFVDLIATPAGDFILEWDDVYEPFSHGKLISAGQFNVTQYVNSNQALSNVYSLWKTVVSGYLVFMFFDLCYKKYNAIVRDRLG